MFWTALGFLARAFCFQLLSRSVTSPCNIPCRDSVVNTKLSKKENWIQFACISHCCGTILRMMISLRDYQTKAVRSMLSDVQVCSDGSDVLHTAHVSKWKVLIYDEACRRIISPLLSVSDLRALGVTVHMLAGHGREYIPDVPAVYFLQPTPDNIQIIAEDCNSGLYEQAHVNFASPLPRALLERLADHTSTGVQGGSHRVSHLKDHHLNFITLEPRLFTLNHRSSYTECMSLTANAANQIVSKTLSGVFSVLVTLGVVPCVQAPCGSPADAVALQLDVKIRNTLRGHRTSHLFKTGVARESRCSEFEPGNRTPSSTIVQTTFCHRPLLILVDRNIDISQVVRHTSLYQSMVHDLLGLHLNRVSFDVSNNLVNGDSSMTTLHMNLDTQTDSFWGEFAGQSFPDAVTGNEMLRKNLQQTERSILSRSDSSGMFAIATTVSKLAKHSDDKKRVNDHLNLLEAMMQIIVSRSLPEFYECEEVMVCAVHAAGSQNQRPEVSAAHAKQCLEILSNPAKGTYMDKLRLALVWIIRCYIKPEYFFEIEKFLHDTAVREGVPPIHSIIFSHVLLDRSPISRRRSPTGQDNDVSQDALHEPTQGAVPWESVFSNMTKTVGGIVGRVKAWIPKQEADTKLTAAVAAITEGRLSELKSLGLPAAFNFYDPYGHEPGAISCSEMQCWRGPLLVFIVGGGTYAEYHNLCAYSSQCRPQKCILFGASEILNAENFLRQVALG